MQLSGFRTLIVCSLLLSSVLFATAAQHAAAEAGQSRKTAAGIGAPASVALPFTITELSGAADAAKTVSRKSSSSSSSSSSGVTSDPVDSSHHSTSSSSSISSAASAAIDAVTRAATLAAVAAKIRAAHLVPSSGGSGSTALPDDAKAKLQQLVLGATFQDAAPAAAAAAGTAAVQATSSASESKPGLTASQSTSGTVIRDAGLEDADTESEIDAEAAAADDADGDDDVTSDIDPAAADEDAAAAAAAAAAALDQSVDADAAADAARAGDSTAVDTDSTDSAESAVEMDLELLLAGDTADAAAAAAAAEDGTSADTAEAASDSAAGDKGAEGAEDPSELQGSGEGDEEVLIIEEEEILDAGAESADTEGADAAEPEAAAAAQPPPPAAAGGGKAAGNAHARIGAAAAADALSAATGHRTTSTSGSAKGASKSSAAAAAADSSDSTVYKKPSSVSDDTPANPQPAPPPAPAPSGVDKKTTPKSDTKSDAHHKGKGSSMSIAQVQKTLQHELKHAAKHPGHGTEATTSTIKAKSTKGTKARHHHHKHTNHSSHAKAGKNSKASKVALSPAALKKVAHALGVSPKVVKTQAQTAIQKHKQLVKLAEQQREKQAALKRQVQQVVQQQLRLQTQAKSELQTKAKADLKQAVAPAPSTVNKQQQEVAAATEAKGQQQDFSNQQQQQQQQQEQKQEQQDEDPKEEEEDQIVEEQEKQQEQQQDEESLTSDALIKLINAADDKSPCFRPLLQPPFFDREKSASLNNAYVAMLLSRYTYPTAFGINVNTNSSRLTYQELFRRKWIALGAKPNTIKFQDIGGGPGARLRKMINAAKPEAHAVVLGTDTDVWIAYRGLTSVDAALTSDLKHSPVDAVFGSRKVAVHSGFYNGFRALWPQVVMAVKAAIMQTDEPTEAKIYITGHSLGGAHALFTGLKLAEMKLKNLGGVYIFGTPRIGGPEFLALFKESGLERITSHWWNELDMVPNLGTAGPWKRSHYQSLPISTLYRIWGGQCKRANQATAQACPLGPHRCKKSINDHRAFSYVAKLQACVLQQPEIESSSCMSSKVMSSM